MVESLKSARDGATFINDPSQGERLFNAGKLPFQNHEPRKQTFVFHKDLGLTMVRIGCKFD